MIQLLFFAVFGLFNEQQSSAFPPNVSLLAFAIFAK